MPETMSGGWKLYYETHGDPANPPIVMILGLSYRLAHWGRLPGLLAERLHVITFDCRGMGQSERRDEPYTIQDEVEDVAAVLDAAGVQRAYVYGRSRGGMIAQEFALTHPERCAGLVLTGTSHRGPGSVGYSDAVTRAMNFTPDMTREQIFETQNIAMAAPGWRERDPEAFAYLLRTDLEAPPRRFAVVRQQEAIASWSSKDRLPSLRMPVLVLCGEDDGMTPPENSRQIAALIPGARLHLIPQCGHNPMLEKPEEVARLVLDFAAAQPSSSR
ncbi:MAG: alpha/beta fold hydrolase [Chloroflexi bacterium]|nr:alpha/beta fold hydrolase [Chloroflexota bacterium]